MRQLAIGAARRVRIPVGDTDVAALQSGDPGAPPVLLLPGYTGSKEDFGPVLDPLAAHGYLVTAVDLPGQYESPGLAEGTDYSPDTLGAVVREISTGLGTQVRLVGHSFGGLVARAAVIAEPTRFASLVLLSSGPAALGGLRRLRIEQLAPVLAGAGLPGVYAAMQAADLEEPGYLAPAPDLADFLQRRFLGGSARMLQGMGEALRTEPDRVAELAATGLPILVAHGVDDDAWEPATQRDMAVRLGATYAVIGAAAHSAAVENPAGLVSVLDRFWR